MAFRLTPHERGFYPLFTKAAENIAGAAEDLAKLVAAEPEHRGELARRIKDAEHTGDSLTHEIFVKLNSTFVTPFDREDIHRLTEALDDTIDAMEDAADRIVLYQLGELPAGIATQVNLLCQAAAATAAAMPRLSTLDQMQEFVTHVNSLEDKADGAYRALIGELLTHTENMTAGDVLNTLKMKEVVETLEEAVDAFETVANTVASIAVKEG